MDAARSVVSTNDLILNRSCRDMGVEASYRNEYGFILRRCRRSFGLKKKPRTIKVVLSSPGQLALELSCDTLRSWPTDGQLPTVKLSGVDLVFWNEMRNGVMVSGCGISKFVFEAKFIQGH
uniref:Uncharacterized protein n=1 Tax=Cucumis melo TaxID=3656 RepID=A0A9I9EK00_CUCME